MRLKRRSRTSAILLLLANAACAKQPDTYEVPTPPGFFMGIVHGFISVFSLIGSLFWDIRIYAFPNSGRWYDAGFVLGAALFFGAIARQDWEKYYVAGYVEGVESGKSENRQSR